MALSKVQAVALFRRHILHTLPDPTDRPAIREAWGIFTDTLCKGGDISPRQYTAWQNPF